MRREKSNVIKHCAECLRQLLSPHLRKTSCASTLGMMKQLAMNLNCRNVPSPGSGVCIVSSACPLAAKLAYIESNLGGRADNWPMWIAGILCADSGKRFDLRSLLGLSTTRFRRSSCHSLMSYKASTIVSQISRCRASAQEC